MDPDLRIEEFIGFFYELHGHSPFPWQNRLALQVAEQGRWPAVLDLPTGFGKTAALDIAVFHLALEADRRRDRRAPVRIALVVDRRLIVDDAFERARRIECRLRDAQAGTVASKVARRLSSLSGDPNCPLLARRLRGGIPREDDWARTPCQPTILCSTVDQVGSRLLFRGYGVSDSMKPVHAGLIGADCLILLDEAHLSEPFRQTLNWVNGYRSERWRECNYESPWHVSNLTATPGAQSDSFRPSAEDYGDPVLQRRWQASKPARLVPVSGGTRRGLKKNELEPAPPQDEQDGGAVAEGKRIEKLVEQTSAALGVLRSAGFMPAIGVVVNRVARARQVFETLLTRWSGHDCVDAPDFVLMIGPARPLDREDLAEKLDAIRTGTARELAKPLVIVATQCIEAGVDIDLDGLITEAAPVDALRQRFGRLNRAGRDLTAYAAIVCDPKADKNDPVYGEAIGKGWEYLTAQAVKRGDDSDSFFDFGLNTFGNITAQHPLPENALAPKLDAPVLLPAHLDLLSKTAPIPNADPEVSLYLHGPGRTADTVMVVWREDVNPELSDAETRRLLLLMPPRSTEAIELPVWAVRRWLTKSGTGLSDLADLPGPPPAETQGRQSRRSFRWAGASELSRWVEPNEVRAGYTIVVPTRYGGVDQYGWNPNLDTFATDIADKAAQPFARRRFAVRVSPALFENESARTKLADSIAAAPSRRWQDFRDAVREIIDHEAQRSHTAVREDAIGNQQGAERLKNVGHLLGRLDSAKRGRIQFETAVYGEDGDERPRGVVFLAPFGLKGEEQPSRSTDLDAPGATEDDLSGSLPGYEQLLSDHSKLVAANAAQFAEQAGLPIERIADLKIAAYLHDAGKVDPRFQSWLAYGDPLGSDPDKVLAKSGRALPPEARRNSDLPEHWRHEAFSVRLAAGSPRFAQAVDPELVLWLIGTHHGHGRPFFPHADAGDCEARTELPTVLDTPPVLPAAPGPQSLAFDFNGLDWPALHDRLRARFGTWELARMETILRLADHRASEQAALRESAAEERSR